MTNEDLAESLAEVQRRLTRIESRLVQLMMHLGMDPAERVYGQQPVTNRKVSK